MAARDVLLIFFIFDLGLIESNLDDYVYRYLQLYKVKIGLEIVLDI